jgi:hypothetical protein
MSVFKPFTTSDIISTPFKLNKTFSYNGISEVTSSGIDIFIGVNTPPTLFTPNSNLTGYISPQNSYLVYNSIKHLYYSNFLENMDGSPSTPVIFNADGTVTGGSETTNFQNYLPSTLLAHRLFPTNPNDEIGIFSIPSNIFGENISPKSLLIESNIGNIIDDGEGRLYYYPLSGDPILTGNIIYEHGMVILNLTSINSIEGYGISNYGVGLYGGGMLSIMDDFTKLEFKSTITIYEVQYKCTLRESEFNYSQNPTTITGSMNDGNIKPYITESYFSPFVTTVGLHNNDGELLAVAKLSQPLPTSPTTDTNIIINLDL